MERNTSPVKEKGSSRLAGVLGAFLLALMIIVFAVAVFRIAFRIWDFIL